jgi:hypothetical protein
MWADADPVGVNMLPLAAEMCDWLGQKNAGLSACIEENRGKAGYATNPYTYHASAIGTALGGIINSVCEFSDETTEMGSIDAEVKRLRLQNELILYCARFCEATIKQMLYCTQIPRRLYKSASLGQLLAIDCEACRKGGREKHDISLLGALAHQYFLCTALEHCMVDHLVFFGRRRNAEAAHAESQNLDPKGVAASRSRLAETMRITGHELGHMTQHIGQIERKMIEEIGLIGRWFPDVPPMREFSQISARPRVAKQPA